MKRCPSCGKVAEDDSLDFCTHCGAYFVVRQDGSPPPDTSVLPDDPLERGEVLLAAGRFPEGAAAFREAAEPDIDDVTYGRMVDALAGCMLGSVLQPQTYRNADIPGLARIMADRELVLDLMRKLSGSLEVCTIQNGVLGLANCYMFLFVDAFVVYPDMRDLREICDSALNDVKAMVDKAVGLVNAYPGKGPGPLDWLDSYRSFVEEMVDAVADIVSSTPKERLDELSARWADVQRPAYAAMVSNAFVLNTQSTATGKFASRILRKTGGSQLKGFSKTYLSGPKG